MKTFYFYTISSWDGALKPLYFGANNVTSSFSLEVERPLRAKSKPDAIRKFKAMKGRGRIQNRVTCLSQKEIRSFF
jgi:hypothetical protein